MRTEPPAGKELTARFTNIRHSRGVADRPGDFCIGTPPATPTDTATAARPPWRCSTLAAATWRSPSTVSHELLSSKHKSSSLAAPGSLPLQASRGSAHADRRRGRNRAPTEVLADGCIGHRDPDFSAEHRRGPGGARCCQRHCFARRRSARERRSSAGLVRVLRFPGAAGRAGPQPPGRGRGASAARSSARASARRSPINSSTSLRSRALSANVPRSCWAAALRRAAAVLAGFAVQATA